MDLAAVLLAWLDGHVSTIAIHLARQGCTVTFDLDDTVNTISGGDDSARLAGQAHRVLTEAAGSVGRRVLWLVRLAPPCPRSSVIALGAPP